MTEKTTFNDVFFGLGQQANDTIETDPFCWLTFRGTEEVSARC